jgi:hypothetical protein
VQQRPGRLVCSLAGGRKTLGALLALAMQLVGRPGDRLFHVRVDEPFESVPDFYYPPRNPAPLLWDGRRLDPHRARVELAEIPLLRLGALTGSLGLDPRSLARGSATVEAAVLGALSSAPLRLDPALRHVSSGGAALRLPPQSFALYALYAERRRACPTCREPGESCVFCHPTDAELHERQRGELLRQYVAVRGFGGDRLVALLSALPPIVGRGTAGRRRHLAAKRIATTTPHFNLPAA